MEIMDIPVLEGIVFYDCHFRFVKMNEAAEVITGFKADEVIGKSCHEDLFNPVSVTGIHFCIQPTEIPEGEAYVEREVFFHHKDGHRILVLSRISRWVIDNKFVGYVEMFYKKKGLSTMPMVHDEYIDPVTGLVNTLYAQAYLERLIEFERTTGTAFGLLVLDIDNFESYNLTYGRHVGDQILSMVTLTLKEVFAEADLIARLHGDEFMLVFSHINSNMLKNYGERLRLVMEYTSLRGVAFKEVDLTVSIGGTLVRPRDTVSLIIERAMDYLKKSKSRGGNRVAIS